VVTLWDWADPKVYLHDAISTDKRNPTVNANGPIYDQTLCLSQEQLSAPNRTAKWCPKGRRPTKTR
jgi:hypothetical protein